VGEGRPGLSLALIRRTAPPYMLHSERERRTAKRSRGAYECDCYGQDERPISTGQLNALTALTPPAYHPVVIRGPSGRSYLERGFALRCFQRLSRPNIATRRCRWRDNRITIGSSTPVLAYWGQLLSNLLRPRRIGTELSHDVLNPAHVPL
jgi:hypothetical protein